MPHGEKGEFCMKFRVNSNCISCGLCEGLCPSVFALEGDGRAHATKEDVPAELESTALEAMESCPVDAIEEE